MKEVAEERPYLVGRGLFLREGGERTHSTIGPEHPGMSLEVARPGRSRRRALEGGCRGDGRESLQNPGPVVEDGPEMATPGGDLTLPGRGTGVVVWFPDASSFARLHQNFGKVQR